MRKVNGLLLLIVIVSMLVTACSGQASNVEGEKSGESSENKQPVMADHITYAITASPEGKFNPLLSNTQYDGYVNALVYDSLLHMNDALQLESGMAESYEVSEDNKKITFHLRDNLLFHDETPVTSEDVKFTLEALAHPDYQGDLQSYVSSIAGYENFHNKESEELSGVVVVDEKTIELNFEEPYSPALINLGKIGILPKHIWSSMPIVDWDKNAEVLSHPVGCGPYTFGQYKSGESVELIGFEKYYGGSPKTSKFLFKVVNEGTVMGELINKSVDISDVSNIKKEEADKLQSSGIVIKRFPNSKIQYLGFNLRDERLQDLNVRTAVAYGIDRKAIVEGLLEGHGLVIDTPMVPTLWSYPKEGLIAYAMEVDKAKNYLKEAGYEDTDGDGFVDKDGKNLKFVLTVPTGDKVREQTGAVIQENLKQIGIEIELDAMDFNAVMEKVVGNHEFDMYLMGNTLEADPDPTPYWHSDQASDEKGKFAWNIAGFRSKEADALMVKNRKELVQEERANTLKEFGQLLNKELPWVPLYAADTTKAYRSELEGYSPNTFVDFYNVQEWHIMQ